MNPDPSTFLSGGYFVTKRIGRPQYVSDLLPNSILTLSTCFTDIAPDVWTDKEYKNDDEERIEEALKFGIPREAVPTVVDQFTKAVESNHIANLFPTLSSAEEFFRHCADEAVVLVGIGLDSSRVSSFKAQLADDCNHGYGLIERVDANIPIVGGGEVLGYEPLGFSGTKFHSWLCLNAPADAYKMFGVRPNGAGFIDSFDDAVRVTQNLKKTGAEPAIWEPWLVVQYASRRSALARFTNSPEGLFRRGFTLDAVKEWRTREHEAGRPSGLDDFLRAHNLCVECRGNGEFAIGVRWRDEDGIERAEEGPVATLVRQHELDNRTKWLTDTRKWDYLYESCQSCGGTGERRNTIHS
jgi:hypothetical protein